MFSSSGHRLSYTSGYVPLRNRSKRPPVLQDQKVLPEVRNRPLLLSEKFKSRTLKKWLRIQQGNSPFHHFNIRYTCGSKLQLEKFLGGWCVVSCKSIQFPKFKVQAQGYAIRYVMVHKSDKSPPPTSLSSFSLVYRLTNRKVSVTECSIQQGIIRFL